MGGGGGGGKDISPGNEKMERFVYKRRGSEEGWGEGLEEGWGEAGTKEREWIEEEGDTEKGGKE